MPATSQKDPWDKLQVIAIVLASLFVPLAVAFVGHTYTSAMKESENRLKYVELAVSILRAEPAPENAALRDWAVEVINNQSVVPLSAQAQAQLKQHRVELGQFGAGTWAYVGSAPSSLGYGGTAPRSAPPRSK